MGLGQSALILLGIGIVSSRFKAGVGLGELGLGVRELVSAPLGGVGTGLGEFGTGLRTFAEALGDVGRGFGELFKHIPKFQPFPELPGEAPWWYPGQAPTNGGPLITVSGGDKTTSLAGGGGSVPPSYTPPSYVPSASQPRVTNLDRPISIYTRERPVMM